MPSLERRSINARPGWRRSVRAMGALTVLAARAAPLQMVGTTVVLVATQVAMPARAVAMGLITTGVIRHRHGLATAGVLLIVGQLLMTDWLSWFGLGQRMGLRERVGRAVTADIISLTMGVPGVEHLELPEFHDELRLLELYRGQLATLPDAVISNVGTLVTVAATAGVLASVSPWLLTLPLFGIPAALNGGWAERRRQNVIEAVIQRRRFLNRYFDISLDPGAAKEIRVFGLADELRRRYQSTHEDVNLEQARAEWVNSFTGAASWAVFAIGFALAIALVAVRVIHRQSSPGQLVVTLSLGAQVTGLVAGTVNLMSWLFSAARTGSRYMWLRDYARGRFRALAPATEAPVPEAIRTGIAIENLTFRYPGAEKVALENVNLLFPAGATVAIVGENGAGKTTLIKLLCRLYEPDQGRITIDGIPLSDIDADSWRRRISAGFQDFSRLELTARETIALGEPAQDWADPALVASMGRAHATEVLDQLADGLDTQLGTRFPGGTDLSGGQWQKLALGRTMLRDAPLLLLLDEPTSALDATTEHILFDRYLSAAKQAARDTGAVTLLVSHRFSTVRSADFIVVVSEGGVIEFGDHRSLTAAGGTYAELYELQARAYR